VTCGVTIASHDALARKQVTGRYDCNCVQGTGTCETKSTETGMFCTKGGSSPCTGTCKLITTRDVAPKAGQKILPEVQPIQPKVQPKVLPKGNIQQQ
jgi:hypothetical protein